MKAAIITYDLLNTKPGDDTRVKQALLAKSAVTSKIQSQNLLSPYLQEVVLKLPDTTLIAEIDDRTFSLADVVAAVLEVIKQVGATPGKVYVAFIDSDLLWNSADELTMPKRLPFYFGSLSGIPSLGLQEVPLIGQ